MPLTNNIIVKRKHTTQKIQENPLSSNTSKNLAA